MEERRERSERRRKYSEGKDEQKDGAGLKLKQQIKLHIARRSYESGKSLSVYLTKTKYLSLPSVMLCSRHL